MDELLNGTYPPEVIETLRVRLADLEARHKKALEDILERGRARRLAQLRTDLTQPTA